jgi:hypothetical protein
MKTRIYITTETFPALVSFLQKGIEQKMKFFIYDEQDSIKSRLWTFSSTAFLPNVSSEDSILQKHHVPVVVCTNLNTLPLDEYSCIMYESVNITTSLNLSKTVFFIQEKSSAREVIQKIGIKNDDCEIFIKNESKWNKLTSLQP